MLTEGFVWCNSFYKKLLAVTNGPGNGIARNGARGSSEPPTVALELQQKPRGLGEGFLPFQQSQNGT